MEEKESKLYKKKESTRKVVKEVRRIFKIKRNLANLKKIIEKKIL